jgi:hypothetical protein
MAYENYISMHGRIYGFNDDSRGELTDLGPDPGYGVPLAFDINAGGYIPTNAPLSPYWNAGALPMDMEAASFNPLTGKHYTHGEKSYLERAGLMGSPGSFGSRFQEMWGDSWVPWAATALIAGAGGYLALGGGAAGGGAASGAAGAAGGAGAVEGAAFGSGPILADTGIAAGSEIAGGGLLGTEAVVGGSALGGASALEASAFGGTGAAETAAAGASGGTSAYSSILRNLATKAPGLLLSALGGGGGGGGGTRTGVQPGSTLGVGGSNEVGGGEAVAKEMQPTPITVQSTYNPYAPVATNPQEAAKTYANPAEEETAKSTQSPLLSELVERSQLGNTLWGSQQQQSAYLENYMKQKNAFDILAFFDALA